MNEKWIKIRENNDEVNKKEKNERKQNAVLSVVGHVRYSCEEKGDNKNKVKTGSSYNKTKEASKKENAKK